MLGMLVKTAQKCALRPKGQPGRMIYFFDRAKQFSGQRLLASLRFDVFSRIAAFVFCLKA
jgi:hypothetical protein